MNRCRTVSALPRPPVRLLAAGLALVLGAALWLGMTAAARAQSKPVAVEDTAPKVRAFPPSALRGTLIVTSPPDIKLDGRTDRLSPGARIRDMQNMLAMSGTLVGREFIVNYTREAAGMVHEVWILTDDEIAEKRPQARPSRNFLFGSEADAPKRDDGKTPYNQLPGYGASTR